MRRLDLNLLSRPMKKALYARVVFSLLERFMISVIVLTLVLTILVLGAEDRFAKNLAAIQSRQLLSTEYVSVNQDIRKLNETIRVIERFQKEVVPASILLEDVMRRTPEGVLISTFTFDAASRSLRLAGHAELRRQLLDYEAALLISPYLEKVESPISNLLQPRDIAFQMNAVVDLDALKKNLEPGTDAR